MGYAIYWGLFLHGLEKEHQGQGERCLGVTPPPTAGHVNGEKYPKPEANVPDIMEDITSSHRIEPN